MKLEYKNTEYKLKINLTNNKIGLINDDVWCNVILNITNKEFNYRINRQSLSKNELEKIIKTIKESYYNKEINKALFHFRMLKFVKKCERILLYYSDKYIELILKDEYKSKFINKEFEENDFKYKNFLKFEYSWDYDLTNIESVYIYLKKPGKNELKKAIKYYEKNKYVKKVEPIAVLVMG